MSATNDQQEYIRLCRTQRQAYFAWQDAPAGQSEMAIVEYQRASKELEAFNKGIRS